MEKIIVLGTGTAGGVNNFNTCFLLENNNNNYLLVDTGGGNGILKQLKMANIDINNIHNIFISHKHIDHIISDVLKDINIPIYSTQEVQNTYPEIKFNIVKENDVLNFGDIKIEVVKAIHGYNPLLKNGGQVFENIGYIIDDCSHRLYTTSDTICFNNDYKADVVALPVTAYGLTMSAFEAALFYKELGASLVLPIHMDNEKFPTNLEYMKENFDKFDINYKVLDIEESIEI